MEVALFILLLVLIGLGFSKLPKLQQPRFKTLLLLTISSLEEDAVSCPEKSLLVRKFLLLPAPPLPGMELDEQGTHRSLKITRTVITERNITVHFEPIRVPVSEVDGYAKNLVDCNWEVLW